MGYGTFKPDKNKDLYVIYSSISDLPVMWGTAEDLLKVAVKNQFVGKFEQELCVSENYERVLERVDEWGASSHMMGCFWDEEFSLNWAGWGTVESPENLIKILELLEQGKDPLSKKVKKLVKKHEWED